jgi:hypothetical protein
MIEVQAGEAGDGQEAKTSTHQADPRRRTGGGSWHGTRDSRYTAGYRVDIGLSQITDRDLPAFGLTIEQAFDPCTNVRTGGIILAGFYGRAVQQFGEGQRALMAALSGYNTGDLQRGFANGYVGKYYINAPLPSSLTPALPARIANALTWPTATPVASIQVYTRPGLNLHASN